MASRTGTALLTLGRLPKGLEIARALHSAGWRVLVAEPHRRHLTGASRSVARSVVVPAPNDSREAYLDALADIVRAERVDLVVPVSEEIIHASFLPERLRQLGAPQVRMHAMAPDSLLALHDKLQFVAVCRDAGVDAPESAAIDSAAAVEIAAAGPYVVKPRHSCSGNGVTFHARGMPLPPDRTTSLVQRFLPGELLSSFSVVREGRVRLSVVYRGVVMQGSVAVCFERIDTPVEIDAWIARFARHVAFDGFLSFDFVRTASGGVQAIECNPRATSGIHFVARESLARALLAPDDRGPLHYRTQRLLQQFYPCLTETQKSMFRRGFFAKLRALRGAADVSFEVRDPWPFIGMPWTSWPIIAESLRRGRTFGEVATLDVGWYPAGDDVAEARISGVS